MEHVDFEAKLCVNISNFKQIGIIDILTILALATSLIKVYCWRVAFPPKARAVVTQCAP